jgi:hypothetical protein
VGETGTKNLALPLRLRRLQGHARCVTPKILEAVELAFFAAEDVHDDLHVIEHDPLARREPVHRHRANTVVVLQPIFDRARDRLQVRFRGSRANNEEIGETRDSLQIEDDDVLCLFVRGEISAGPG